MGYPFDDLAASWIGSLDGSVSMKAALAFIADVQYILCSREIRSSCTRAGVAWKVDTRKPHMSLNLQIRSSSSGLLASPVALIKSSASFSRPQIKNYAGKSCASQCRSAGHPRSPRTAPWQLCNLCEPVLQLDDPVILFGLLSPART